MADYRIYCKSRSPLQSGQANTGEWILEPVRPTAQKPEPLMGWTQSGDTLNQIKLEFPTRKGAETFAKSKGWRYTVTQANERKIKPRNYGDKFVYDADN